MKSKHATASFFPWIVFSLGAAFYCYEYLLRMSPSVMTNTLMASFGIDAAVLGNLIAYYYYLYTPMQLPVGILMDRYGPRRLLIFACLVCVIGAFWFAHTQHLWSLGYARLLIGFGSSFAFVGVLKIASLWLPENRFALAGGLTMFLGMAGPIIGDNIVPALVTHFGWREATVYEAYAGIFLTLLIALFMRHKPEPLLADEKEAFKPEPTFHRLFSEMWILIKNKHLWINGIVGAVMYLPLSAFAEFWGVPFLRTVYQMTREEAGEAVSMVFLGVALGAPLIGFLSDYVRQRRIFVIVGSFMASLLGFILVHFTGLDKVALFAVLFLFGLTSAVQNLVFPISREISPEDMAGTAVAITNTLVMAGGVIFLPLIGYLIHLHWDGLMANNTPIYSLLNYKEALFFIPVAMSIGAFLMFFMPETHAEVDKVH